MVLMFHIKKSEKDKTQDISSPERERELCHEANTLEAVRYVNT